MKLKKRFLIPFCVFLIIQVVLYVLILFVPSLKHTNVWEYISICLSFAFALFALIICRGRLSLFVSLALFFTLVADTFLVLLNPWLNVITQSIAMTSFSFCQMIYLYILWLYSKNKTERIINLCIRLVVFLGLLITAIIMLKSQFSYLVAISLFYFSQLFCNIVFAFLHVKENPLLAIGLLLFIGCDLVIGFQNICTIFSLSDTNLIYIIAYSSFNITWLFYLPSQVILSISSLWKNPFIHR